MKINIRLSDQGKDSLDYLKQEHSFRSYNECLISIKHFFKEHHLSPREKLSTSFITSVLESKIELKSELKREFEELKKFIREDSQSLRKRHGAIEKSYLLPIEKKVSNIDEYVTKKELENRNLQFSKSDELDTKNEIIILEKTIGEREKSIEENCKKIEKLESKIDQYKNTIRQIYDHYILEKSTFGKDKIYIEMSKEEFEKLLN